MTTRRLLPRFLFLAVVFALFGIGGFLAWFQSWRAGQMLDLAARSEVVDLPAGEMEFALRGSGKPLLVFHSAPGGYDQALALGGFLEEEGFQILAPSRPGYLRTPLSTGPTPQKQAEASAELLDHLEIPKVAVVGFGWGGSTAVEFARRFPDRTSALVLVSAATSETPPAPGIPLPESVAEKIGGDLGSWRLVKNAERKPARMLEDAFELTSTGNAEARSAWRDFVLKDPAGLERFREIVLSLAPMASREAGLENDLQQPLASFRGLTPPVLLVQGAMDKAVPPAAGEPERFFPVELFRLPGEGHLVLLGPGFPAAAKRVLDFLNLHHTVENPEDTTDGE